MCPKVSSEAVVREIKRKTRRKFSSEENIRIVLDGLRGEESIAEIFCPCIDFKPLLKRRFFIGNCSSYQQ